MIERRLVLKAAALLAMVTSGLGVRAQPADGPLCVNSICIGQAVQDLPAEAFDRVSDLKVLRKVPQYAAYRNFFDDVERKPLNEQAYFLAAVTQQFDGYFIRFVQGRADFLTTGVCAQNVALSGAFRDAQGRTVEVTVSGVQPPGKVSGFYVTQIKKVFGRDLDMKRFEAEVRKTWPSALSKEFSEEEAPRRRVVVDTLLGHLLLQATSDERIAWSKAALASDVCASFRRDQSSKYQIN